MNQQEWKSAARSKLEVLARRARQLAPGTIYGALCSSTLLPVLTAFGGGDFGVLATLGSVIGGVGGNLIANQIQGWKDRGEEDLAAELNERAEKDPEWRAALDTLLDKLEALSVVQGHLSDEDKKWFSQVLGEELAKLGNLTKFEAALLGSGATAQGPNAMAAGERGAVIGGDADTVQTGDDNIAVGGHVVVAKEGATVVIGDAPVPMTAVDRDSALGRYLSHVIGRNRYLLLQGIRSGGRLVHIELDRIYIRLRASRQRAVESEERWLAEEGARAPGEDQRLRERPGVTTESVTVKVEEALAEHDRLVVLGDPGGGKTTLLRYLALLYARDLAESSILVQDELGLLESGHLPILLPLRQIGAFLGQHLPEEDGTEGHALLLDHLYGSLKNERIELPSDFFDEWLTSGQAVILLDGLDEVADPGLRRRVSRLVESFTRAYSRCRYVVTSRIVGYTGPARLGEDYATTTVRDFTMAEVKQFLTNWHRLVATGLMGPSESAETYATEQTGQLLTAIQENDRIRELAINPLMLTVIAMLHRDRVKLPDRRAELYAEAVDVLLGKWEEAKGVQELPILPDKPFDTGDKRLMLQSLALHMHEQEQREIGLGDLGEFLEKRFLEILGDQREAERAVTRFLSVIEERTGLLTARGEGVYAFSHLTFQEYMAALAVAGRNDYIEYTLGRVTDAGWREVILLEAGYLSTQSKERTTDLIQAIADLRPDAEPYHNLVLAAECIRDVGENRVLGDLQGGVKLRLRAELETPAPSGLLGTVQVLFKRGMTPKTLAELRVAAATALARIGGERYWSLPYGEPEWADVPAGEFWMGSERGQEREKPQQQLYLDAFRIARAPITNAQYHLFVQNTGGAAPSHWEEDRPPRGLESHPVVNVSWHDAMGYCKWLGGMTGVAITLPSEAEWEKAVRGDRDRREYPWGDEFDSTKCNCRELELRITTPVGIFPNGASPYGCLDMAGNVWEWTRSLFRDYPYDPGDGREDLSAPDEVGRVLRGGAFDDLANLVRCAYRDGDGPNDWIGSVGFRVVASPCTSGL